MMLTFLRDYGFFASFSAARARLMLLCLLLAGGLNPLWAQEDAPTAVGSGSGLIVSGVDIDVTARNQADARREGWQQAQRLAWPRLWARVSGQDAEKAPALADSALDAIVSAIEIEREQMGPTRYVARLAVVFDRERAARYLGAHAGLATSPPLLLFPVLQDAATRLAHEPESPWLQAWARMRAGESPIDYIRIQPTSGDILLLSAWQAERRHVAIWRRLVERYQVADVLIPELILERSWSGGPLRALLIVRFGTQGQELGRRSFDAPNGDVVALLDEAVREADRIYISALRAGSLLPDPELLRWDDMPEFVDTSPTIGAREQGVELFRLNLRVATSDDAALATIERLLRGLEGVLSVQTLAYVPGGESRLSVASGTERELLLLALDQRGYRIDGDLLRPRRPDEAPLLPPAATGGADINGAAPVTVIPDGA